MANEAVLKYLLDTNRPYSCADVTTNLRGAFTKGAVQKALDAESENGKIKCKVYGKQKVYAAIQEAKTSEGGDDDQIDYNAEIKKTTQELSDKSDILKTADNNLKTIVSAPATETAIAQIDEIKKFVDESKAKLDVLKHSTGSVDAKTLVDEHEKYLKQYRSRKRLCNEIIEAIMEGYPKSKKCLLEELCVETDEMVNFKLASLEY